jgi:hypothetical protein
MVDRIPKDPVDFWLSRLDADTRKANCSHFNRWMKWLNKQPGWKSLTPRGLLVRQLEYQEKYVILDLLQNCIKGLGSQELQEERVLGCSFLLGS